MVVLSFVKYGNIHNAINFTFSIHCDAYLHIYYGLLHTFSSGPLRFCQQKHFSSFDSHAFCARCREKGKGTVDCVKKPQSSDCKVCNAFSEEQCLQLPTLSYRIKKEKREAKKLEATPTKDGEDLIDPSSVSVIGPVEKPSTSKPPVEAPPPDKKIKKYSKKVGKKDKSPAATVSKPPLASADDKIADLDSKSSERFNRLEALIMTKNCEPQFSANVKVTPTHSPPSSVEHVSEPFI